MHSVGKAQQRGAEPGISRIGGGRSHDDEGCGGDTVSGYPHHHEPVDIEVEVHPELDLDLSAPA